MEISVSGPMYAALGYDFLVVTDHNKALDARQWSQWQDSANLILVPGEENGATDHIVEVGVHQVTSTHDEMYVDRARILRQSGGFIVGAHPQEYPHGAENIRAAADELHAFEIFNGLREARGCDEFANITLWDELLTDSKQIWGVAVDDFHCDYITPGHGWVWVQIPENLTSVTWSTIVDQLKTGAFYATTYPRIHSVVHEHDALHVHADQHTQRLKVIGPGGDTLYEVQSNQLKWQPPVGLAYFRVEAECGIKRAWSQPFYESPPTACNRVLS
jgi:hypothetical protein